MIGADDRAALNAAADILVRLPTVLAAERHPPWPVPRSSRRTDRRGQADREQVGDPPSASPLVHPSRPAPLAGRPVTAVRPSITGYRPVPAAHGAMLGGMAACPPAPDGHADPLGGLTPAQRAEQEAAVRLRHARHATAITVGSPVGQLRAMAWLLGVSKPALSPYTCSRLAAGAGRAGGYYAALSWLVSAGLNPAGADAVAGLVWPGQKRADGRVGEGPAVRARSRRRPVDVGLGAAGSTTK